MAVDDSVGRVLEYLDEKGIDENTLVVYAGDNGYFWGEHGMVDKRYAYEESIRIPHLLRYPRLVPDGGRTVDDMVLNIDLMPTLLAAAGLDVPDRVQGADYLGLCRGGDIPWRDSWLYEYYEDIGFPHPPMRAVRTRDWKLIKYKRSYTQLEKFPDEMYNLAEDPGEMNNLAGNPDYADKKKELTKELASFIREVS